MNTIVLNAIGHAVFTSFFHGACIYALYLAGREMVCRSHAGLRYAMSGFTLALLSADFLFGFVRRLFTPQKTTGLFFGTDLVPKSQPAFDPEVWFASHAQLIGTVYLAGFFLIGCWLLLSLFHLQKLRAQRPVDGGHAWQQKLDALVQKTGVKKAVRLVLSGTSLVPCTIGHIRPLIFFPAGMLSGLSTEQIEAILLHELGHIRRNDYLFNIAQHIAESLLFFNPFAWLVSRDIRTAREHCCDDFVLEHQGSPMIYARALTAVQSFGTRHHRFAPAASGKKKSSLFKRIIRMTSMKTAQSSPRQKMILLGGIITICASLAWIAPDEKLPVKKAVPKAVPVVPALVADTTRPPQKGKKMPVPPPEPNRKLPPPPPPPMPDTNRKHAFHIRISDKNGQTKEYNSVSEMPEDLRHEFLAENHPGMFFADTSMAADLRKQFESPEWKKQMADIQANADALQKKLNSKEWKEQQALIEKNARDLQKKFDSPEWKAQMAKIQANAYALQKKFDSPEWKKQMADIQANADALQKKFNSKEWKEQQALIEKNARDLQKKFDSPEWKAQMKAIEENAEKAARDAQKREKAKN
ncbi:MAG: M48 family metalloprotease [Mucilaginibacter polytrichastri]|nr:M48 family metalloprotease [Mucilaginibacter polytrichastri]